MTARDERDASGRRLRFTGEQEDGDVSGLYYLRARYYDPALGRFWTQDPWGGSAASPRTLNAYPYVGSNPANATDPYGLCGFGSWGDFADCIVDPISTGAEYVIDFLIDVTYPHRAQLTTAIEGAFLAGSRGRVQPKEGGITVVYNCRGLCELVDAGAFTIGHTIFTTHETCARASSPTRGAMCSSMRSSAICSGLSTWGILA